MENIIFSLLFAQIEFYINISYNHRLLLLKKECNVLVDKVLHKENTMNNVVNNSPQTTSQIEYAKGFMNRNRKVCKWSFLFKEYIE